MGNRWCDNLSLWKMANKYLIAVCLCYLPIINNCFAQNQQTETELFQKKNGWDSPYFPIGEPYHSFNPMPSASYAYGTYHNGGSGGRIVEKASIHPLYHGRPRGIYHRPPGPLLYSRSPMPSGPYAPAQYSGYFYLQDKHRKPTRPATQTFHSNAYYPPNNVWTPLPNHPPTSAYLPVHSHSSSPPPRPPPMPISYSPKYPPLAGVVPSGPVAGSNMETYQEALDLFSEVVHKLEKEPRHGFGGPHSYSQSPSTLLSNGIYETSPMSPSPTVSGFPPHLDHIMGPEFLQRAHKLYNKIIKEQNARPPHYHPNSISSPPAPSHQALIYEKTIPYHPGYGGLSYLEGVIQGEGPMMRKSHYARNFMGPSARTSLVDSVKAIELPVKNNLDSQTADHQTGSTEEMLLTSESNMPPPQIETLPESENPNIPQVTQPLAEDMIPLASAAVAATPPQPSQTFSRNFPENDNSYVEHPLPYEEYEGLIKEIAINYKK